MKSHNHHILQGSLTKGLIKLSGPVVLAMFFSSLLNIVDTFWVGKISALAVAAVSMSWPIIFILIALSAGISTGCNALVAKYFGAKDVGKAAVVAQNSLVLGFFMALVLTIVGVFVNPWLFKFLGAEGETFFAALDYANIIFYGTIFLVITFVLSAVLRGEGDSKTPMKIGIGVNVLNMILDPIFIFWFGWGIRGVAWATTLSSLVGVLLYILYFVQGKSVIPLRFKNIIIDRKIIYDILFIGIPASLRNVANAIGVFFTIKIVAWHGIAAVAAYGIAFRIESFGVLPVVAVALSTITMVGQNLGANQFDRAKKSGWASVGLGALMMAVFGFFVFIFSQTIVAIFNNDAEVVKIGQEVLMIKSPAFLFSAVILILGSAFQAFGKSHYSLVLTVVRVALMISLAYWFNSIWGLVGVWWAITLSGVVSAVFNASWYYFYQPSQTGNN